ncbi:MAG: FAD-dependent oxidoreductase, partial [bacterium]
ELEPKGHMGPCNLWNVAPSKDVVSFPRCPWAIDLSDKPFPGRNKEKPDPHKLGGWYWESGFDRDPMQEMEYVRDWNFRAMYGAWDALKNVDKVLPDYTLNWSAYILGKRESRRLMGDMVLTWDDLVKDRQFPDAAAPTGWSNDLHLLDPAYEKGFKGDAFISHALFGQFPAYKEKRPFWIPYRALYSRNITNLFMAGRNISVKHEALGAVRVMRTGGCMGEVVGMAASLCVKHDAPPRTVYEKHLAELQGIMRRGTGKVPSQQIDDKGQWQLRPANLALPAWFKEAGTNFARTARATIPGSPKAGLQTEMLLNDGNGRVEDNSARWISKEALPHIVEFSWETPVQLGAARIISGYFRNADVVSPVQDFAFQWYDGTAWQDIPEAKVTGNKNPAWSGLFTPVVTTRLRLTVTVTPGDISRIWEVELYAPPRREQP